MRIFSKASPAHLIPIDRANTNNKDWVILVEAGTIVGSSTDRIRVARATQERKIVKKYDLFLGLTTTWSLRATTRESTLSIFARSSTNTTAIKSWRPYRGKKSVN